LRARVKAVLVDERQCRYAWVSAAQPVLIRDLHGSIAAGRDVAELPDLATLPHTQGSREWLTNPSRW
ncbi:MAG: XRE family transcriptional regulator, partial [Pseudonocardiaceae bacterium]